MAQRNGSIVFLVGVLAFAGCQNCGTAARDAEEATVAAEAAITEQAAAEAAAAEKAAADGAAREAQAAAERAQEEAERAAREAARRHTVVAGDCLWCIAEDRWGDGKRWGVIYDANREQIKDPDLIYPGQVFTIPSGA